MALTDTKEKLTNDVIDIEIPEIRKKRFRIDGDNNKILELNTSDFSIINRLDSIYKKLNKLASEASTQYVTEDSDTDDIEAVGRAISDIDGKMRNLIDELFDANVSEVCAPEGSMIDLFNGEYRFEHILKVIFKLYESNISKEFDKMSARMNKHTAKYTKKKTK